MYPYIHIGHFTIGTFGLLLWLAAVCAGAVLHRNFLRFRVDADAVSIVALVTVLGVVGAKLWHVLETPHLLFLEPKTMLLDRAGFAWYGGLVAGILTLMWQGRQAGTGAVGMLDLASPSAAVGYGVGRLGCLISGDGDYGKPTKLPWGMSFPHGLVPTFERVHPTPLYEFLGALIVAGILWHHAGRPGGRRVGEVTGLYLVLSGSARFMVEFIRINQPIFHGLTNAQLASVGSIVLGVGFFLWALRQPTVNRVSDDPIPARAG